jgi:hypothetical protein
MDVRMREVPGQVVVTEQRMVDQEALERWLPEAMARVHKAAGDMGSWHIGPASAQLAVALTPRRLRANWTFHVVDI